MTIFYTQNDIFKYKVSEKIDSIYNFTIRKITNLNDNNIIKCIYLKI